ncbi:hypothetical protein NCCP133_33140 [Cytobacillus sp. NCCP-133]|nr:hypothetical protein NCCP133_33140 [Cytobacillus sp. NCCP-133]
MWIDNGELLCEVTGKFTFEAAAREDYPAVGDWVAVRERVGEKRGIYSCCSAKEKQILKKICRNKHRRTNSGC